MAHSAELVELGKITFFLIDVLLFFTWTTVALRIWVRTAITKSPGWDDATMVMALCLFTCYCAYILKITVASAGDHQFTAKEVMRSLVFIQLSELFYILTTTFLKISLGLFFLRLLTQPWQTRLFQAVLALSGLYGVFYFFATLFVCGNPTNFANHFLGPEGCTPTWFILSTGYIYGIINVLADWIFTFIPIVILLDSDMDRQSKISVGIVMSFAAVGSISSILRMVYLKGLLFRGTLTASLIKATIWATAEPGTGIIAASVAILRPLFRKLYVDVRDKLSEYGNSQSSSHDRSTVQVTTREGDTESVIGLTALPATGGDHPRLSKQSMLSVELDDTWDDWVSTEQTRVGVGKAVTINAGQGVKTVPLRKR